jgi:hypothetical protein
MKTTQTLLLGAVAAALLTATATVQAADFSVKGGATRLVYLHAPNNATPSVTVWIPKKATRSSGEVATTKGSATRLVYLHAPNNATPSVTVWTGK